MDVKKLIEKIPAIQCPEGCTDCCSPVLLLRSEAIALGMNETRTYLQPLGDNFKCELCSDGEGCGDYENRPFTCKLFGAVKGGPLSCTKVLNPTEELMEVEDAAKIMADYLYLIHRTRDEQLIDTCGRFSELHDGREHKKGNLQTRSKKKVVVQGIRMWFDEYVHLKILAERIEKK